jgi:hypothetical protein
MKPLAIEKKAKSYRIETSVPETEDGDNRD